MLLGFRVSNFLSFNEEQSFSMIAGSDSSHPEHVLLDDGLNILKTTLFYGANASGKTNLIKAMLYSKSLVTGENIESEFKMHDCDDLSFSHAINSTSNPSSSFEYYIRIGKHSYAYGFDVNTINGCIISEWAYDITSEEEVELFNVGDGARLTEQYTNFNTQLDKQYDNYLKSQKKTSFLTYLNSQTDLTPSLKKTIKSICDWFRYSLIIKTFDSPNHDIIVLKNKYLEKLNSITTYDTGITIITNKPLKRTPQEEKYTRYCPEEPYAAVLIEPDFMSIRNQRDNNRCFDAVFFDHVGGRRGLIDEESRGTKRLIELLTIINSVCVPVDKKTHLNLNDVGDKTIVIDEIECGLHPNISRKLVQEFLSDESSNSQLIFTTHESRLLDLDIVRKDEIWLVDTKYSGRKQSLLVPVCQYDETSADLRRLYLRGRFGAIPQIHSVMEEGLE